MRQVRPVFLAALLLAFLTFPTHLTNGSLDLANAQFETAKACFNRQEHHRALRLLGWARENSPSSGAPWLLAGHCLYLLGQDPAALFHYKKARSLNPEAFPLPRFASTLRDTSPKASLRFSLRELYTLRKKIGQMLMVSMPGTALSGQKKDLLKAGWVGGVILFTQNVESKQQVTSYIGSLQEHSPIPLFVAVDQEGGAVRRFTEEKGFQRLPSLAALGRTKDLSLAYRFGLLSGAQLKEVGANLNLAPVVDLDHGADDPIIARYQRSLGGDPETVTRLASQIIRGMRDKGVLATAKHFPTQSAAAANPHEGMSVSDRPSGELEAKDLLPYRTLIGEKNLDAVMLSHVVYKDLDPFFPASLSTEVVQKLLRGKLGYQGLVICDDLRMEAVKGRFSLERSVVQAVNAGVDILLVTDNMERRIMETLVEAVASGRVAHATVDEAYRRIMGTKAKYGLIARAPVPRPQAEARVLGVPSSQPKQELGAPVPTKGQAARPGPSPQGEAQALVAPIPSTGKGRSPTEARVLGVPSSQPKQELGAPLPAARQPHSRPKVVPAAQPEPAPPAAPAPSDPQEIPAPPEEIPSVQADSPRGQADI